MPFGRSGPSHSGFYTVSTLLASLSFGWPDVEQWRVSFCQSAPPQIFFFFFFLLVSSLVILLLLLVVVVVVVVPQAVAAVRRRRPRGRGPRGSVRDGSPC